MENREGSSMSVYDNRFDDFFVDKIYLKFKRHLWNYKVRRSKVLRALELLPQGLTLEVGAGVAPMVLASSRVVYTDLSEAAITHLKSRFPHCESYVAEAGHLPFENHRFVNVVSSEVLEHVTDDRAAFREIFRVLAPGGNLVLTVPCHAYFFSIDDEFVHHVRRYDPAALCGELTRLGFTDIKIWPVTGILDKAAFVAAVAIFRIFSPKASKNNPQQKRKRHLVFSAIFPIYVVLNFIYAFLVKLEARIIPLAWATSMIVVARKGDFDAKS
ncbi:MAG TPA: class I SAM-dependent methyltransferase [Candidatus Omnitrophota bacterium]|nr:class I SAM-dependent methyltransferase [Candidatus Omnitrophota bacterium]